MNIKVRDEPIYERQINRGNFTHRVLIAAGISLGLVVLLFLIWQLADVLLVVFGGILLAILLRSLSHGLSQHSRLSEGWSLTVVVGALVLIIAAAGWLFAPELADQFEQLSESFPQAIERVQEYAPEWSRPLTSRLPSVDDMMSGDSDMLSRLTRIFSTTLGAVANVVVILAIAIYAAGE
jgi:predicted PurR-regulated permease PerM